MKALIKKENTVNFNHIGQGFGFVFVGLIAILLKSYHSHAEAVGVALILIGSCSWILPELLYGESIDSASLRRDQE